MSRDFKLARNVSCEEYTFSPVRGYFFRVQMSRKVRMSSLCNYYTRIKSTNTQMKRGVTSRWMTAVTSITFSTRSHHHHDHHQSLLSLLYFMRPVERNGTSRRRELWLSSDTMAKDSWDWRSERSTSVSETNRKSTKAAWSCPLSPSPSSLFLFFVTLFIDSLPGYLTFF